MTTTAHDDQFTDAPESVRQPYDAGSILRRNVAELEVALRKQTERANAELIKAIRDEDKGLGEHAMLSARIIHNTVTVMQAANLEWRIGKGSDVAMAWIENLLIDTDNIPEEEYEGAGDLTNAHDPDLYFRDNHLSGELSPYQSRMAPLIDELERRLESVTAERDHWKANHDNRVEAARFLIEREDIPAERVMAYQNYLALRAERDAIAAKIQKLERQEPVAFWWIGPDGKDNGGPYRGKPSDAAIDNARNSGCEPHLLFAAPVPAPSMPTDEHIHAAYRVALGQSIRERDMPEIRKFVRALLQSTQQANAVPAVPDGDDFNGSTPHLIQCMEALVRLDADGVLVPHGIGRDASKLLSAAANRLRKQPAPSVPEEWPAMLRTGRFIRREAWNPEAFIWFLPGDEKNHSTVMLYTHGKVHAGWIGLHCDHHARDWVYCDDMANDLLQSAEVTK